MKRLIKKRDEIDENVDLEAGWKGWKYWLTKKRDETDNNVD